MSISPSDALKDQTCILCGCSGGSSEIAQIRSNVRKFREQRFQVWRCPDCQSLHCEKVDDLESYYKDYVFRCAPSGYFFNQWFRILLKRLVRSGLRPEDSLLDYGCGSGLLLEYLKRHGYRNCHGYDPYVERYRDESVLNQTYDVILSFDVIEHVESPQVLVTSLKKLIKSDGWLCIFTPRADGIDLERSEEFINALHMPYHLHILSEDALIRMFAQKGFKFDCIYRRWFQDSWMPLTSRRFIEGLQKSHGNDVDSLFEPLRLGVILTTPSLWFHSVFGYFIPLKREDTMMIIFRRATSRSAKKDGHY